MSDIIPRLNAALEGRYRVERELGKGGMATVYLADDVKHERKVALKVLKSELAAVVGAERFLTEIKTTANLQHPHVLPLFDSGEADGFLFYVMPYIEGETLRERLDRERQLPVDEAVRISRAIAHALQTAHDQGIVHRDIKPANILMSRGEPLVADFGIALAVGAAGGSRLTETGLSVGTPYYMSPEQATGDQHVGPPSDIYALAAMTYEMLTGDPPYIGGTAQAVLGKIIQGELVSATAVRKSIPPHVDAAIRKALEKLPADRFTRAEDFARALEDPSFRHGRVGATPEADRRWKAGAIGAGVLSVALLGVLIWSSTRSEPPEPITRVAVDVEEGQGFHTARGELDLSDDGTLMVYRGHGAAGQPQLWLRRWDVLNATPLADTENGQGPAISPDGQEVAFGVSGTIRVTPLQGGVSRTVTEDAVCCPEWSPDGQWIYYTAAAPVGVSRVPAGGGPSERLTTPDSAASEAFHVFPTTLPGGKGVVYQAVGGENLTENHVQALDLETGERSNLIPGKTPRYIQETGHLLFMDQGEGTLLAAPFDVQALELTGPAFPVVEGVLEHDQGWPFFDISTTGRMVYRTGSTSGGFVTPTWVERDGTARPVDPEWAFQGTPQLSSLALSPDGTRLVASITDAEGNTDLWVKPLDEGPAFRLTFEGAVNIRPGWSQDGQYVTFVSDRAGQRDLWRKRADGSGRAELVLDRERPIQEFARTPDGEWLVFVESDQGITGSDIYALRPGVDSAATALVTEGNALEISLSPDGRWLAYTWSRDGDIQVYVRPFPDVNSGRWQISTARGDEPMWSPSGRELFYQGRGNPGTQMAAQIVTEPAFAVGRHSELFPLTPFLVGDGHAQYDVTSDGARFVMLQARDAESQLILVENWVEELRRRGEGR